MFLLVLGLLSGCAPAETVSETAIPPAGETSAANSNASRTPNPTLEHAVSETGTPPLEIAAAGAAILRQTTTPGAGSIEIPREEGSRNVTANNMRLETSSTIRDVVNHPAFPGFGQFILPLDRARYDPAMQLENIASLLPYHSNIDPGAVVNTINQMIDMAASGETIFYNIYTDQQKQSDPSRKSTGLFFFRGQPGAAFAVINPGGGFSYVGSVHEGFPHAIALSEQGYNAFVLQYRVGGEQMACEDLAAALSYIFENAETLRVGTENYSVWGSSAGARMAARIGSYGAAAYGGDEIPLPGTIVMAYTAHSDFTQSDPPTFAVVGDRDGIASASTMERRVHALRRAGIDVAFQIYPNVGHGFGLGIGTSAEGWLEDAVRFWEQHMSASSSQ